MYKQWHNISNVIHFKVNIILLYFHSALLKTTLRDKGHLYCIIIIIIIIIIIVIIIIIKCWIQTKTRGSRVKNGGGVGWNASEWKYDCRLQNNVQKKWLCFLVNFISDV